MFNLSGSEIVVILLLALVVLGPEKLPDAIRRAGRTYAELKKMGDSFRTEMRSVLDEPMQEMRETADLLRQSVDFTEGELGGKTLANPRSGSAPAPKSGADAAPHDETARAAGQAETPAAPAPAGDTPATSRLEPAAPARADEDPEQALINRTLSGGQ